MCDIVTEPNWSRLDSEVISKSLNSTVCSINSTCTVVQYTSGLSLYNSNICSSVCQMGNSGFVLKQSVFDHHSTYFHLWVGSHFWGTRRFFSGVIFPLFIAFFPPNALQCVCSPLAKHLNVVDVRGSDASPCVWTGSQRKGRCLKPGPGVGSLTETHGTEPQCGADVNELNCSLVKQFDIVQSTVWRSASDQSRALLLCVVDDERSFGEEPPVVA